VRLRFVDNYPWHEAGDDVLRERKFVTSLGDRNPSKSGSDLTERKPSLAVCLYLRRLFGGREHGLEVQTRDKSA